MKKLIIDMDDVLCKNGFKNLVNDFLKTNYKAEDANSYFVNDLIPEEKRDEWIEFFKHKNVYDYVDIEDDVQNVIKKLNNKYQV